MIGQETTPTEWSERLGTNKSQEIVEMLHCFHERPLVLRDPIARMRIVTRPLLEAIDVRCRNIAPLTLMDVAKNPELVIDSTFAGVIFDWGNICARAESEEHKEPGEDESAAIIGTPQPQCASPLIELTNTVGKMLEERLAKPAFAEIARSLPIGSGLPRDIEGATFDGFWMTLTHLVVFLAIDDEESAKILHPWCDFYTNGNLPIGLTEDNTFLFLTR